MLSQAVTSSKSITDVDLSRCGVGDNVAWALGQVCIWW